MTIEEFAIKAVTGGEHGGVPFLPHGRGWEAWDCYGLLCVGHYEVLDVVLNPFTNDHDIVNDRDVIAKMYREGAKEHWQKVEVPQAMDAVLLFMYGRACHVGLMIDKERFLHVEQGIETCVQRLSDKSIRTEGFYRYVK